MSRTGAAGSATVRSVLVSRKWLAITVCTVLLMVAFAVLSHWQWSRAQEQIAADSAASAAPAAVNELMVPDEPIAASSLGRVGTVRGSYVEQTRIPGRLSASGQRGDLIVAGVDDGSGHLTAVVRGWVPADATATLPVGEYEIAGRVHTDENFYGDSPTDAAGDLRTVTSAGFADAWDAPVRPGYLVLAEQEPPLRAGDPTPVPPVFGEASAAGGLPLQNLGYAAQWLAFVGVAAFMWWRWFADDMRAAAAPPDPARPAPVTADSVPGASDS